MFIVKQHYAEGAFCVEPVSPSEFKELTHDDALHCYWDEDVAKQSAAKRNAHLIERQRSRLADLERQVAEVAQSGAVLKVAR